ncbi:3-beta-hydroxylase [Beta vulgaris subsp. vulgaris]|uniref:3-beta-hydroxylase n=1 Tax=Beta vulgaris subsp. vulgaris TaxID=3555 RepID=UPI000540097B|nr:3-beta-hydroxylase [Beta vulgaris subsp. vulgaris]
MEIMYSLFLPLLHKLIFHPCFLPLLLFVIIFYKFLFRTRATGQNLPPSPPKLPIIGNLHQLGQLLHRSLHALSKKHGDLMFVYMGCKPTLVVSSADAAREIMRTHDTIFSNRPKSRSASRLFYNCTDVAFSPYGDHWRQIRSICVTQLLSSNKVQSFRRIREEEVALMVEKIKTSCSSVVNLRQILVTFTNDVICRASFGRKYSGNHEGDIRFEKLSEKVMKLLGAFSVGDFIPWLSWIDRVNGLEGRLEDVATRMDAFLEKVIQEHQYGLSSQKTIHNESEKGENVINFVDILLEIQRENKDALSVDNIKAVILYMFAAGTDTTFTLIEWTIFELITNPRVLKELQEEIRKTVQGKSRSVCEDDLEKLTYLRAVVKEALRLHPPAPLLVFRESLQDVKIYGFDIAAGTQVIINAWAIQRDPSFWEEPEEFRPERFLNTSLYDFKGQNFQYIPFGAGRRGCPGISFGMVDAELAIATLMYEFDWKFSGEKLDMTELQGLTVARRDPLMAIATPFACK